MENSIYIFDSTQQYAELFRRDGVVILRNIISAKIADNIKREMQLANESKPYIGVIKEKTCLVSRENQNHHRFRFKDMYINFEDARNAIMAPRLIDLLYEITGEPVLAFQSLGFTRGSNLRVHRDSNFIAVDKPETVIGTWIALEDIEEGSGELAYYPGSHFFPPYHLSEGSLQRIKKAGKAFFNNDDYVDYLQQQITNNHLEEKRFLARKGDCLVWQADIVHTGTLVTQPELTRYSLATHFCALSAQPNYFNFFKNASIVRHNEKASFCSTHYNLTDIPESSLLKSRIIKPNLPLPAKE